MDKKTLKQSVIHKIMDRAIEINKACKEDVQIFRLCFRESVKTH